ncbi:MAG: hypothetical protein OXF79_14955 [Chloroflexi bacterium]|nr:hypothetical protein [Chloroflexota bacterium]
MNGSEKRDSDWETYKGAGNSAIERLAWMAGRMSHLATKEDTSNLKTDLVKAIGDKQESILKWQIGILITTVVALVVATVAVVAK